MLSPVFHPNIAPHAICVGDHWGAGESLQSIVARIGEMLAYQSYNVKSPLNGEAARWVDGNKDKLPLDAVSMLVEDERPANGATMAPSAAESRRSSERTSDSAVGVSATPSAQAIGASPSQPAANSGESASPAPSPSPTTPTAVVACTHCQTAYSVAAEFIGRKVRCRKCMQVFVAAAPQG
jgi:predicted Zn finger-like uncharacterized protein